MRTAYKIADKTAEIVATACERHFGLCAVATWCAVLIFMLATL